MRRPDSRPRRSTWPPGEGRNAIWLARRGWDVTAVDFSQVALDKGRRLAGRHPRCTWVCADATTWRGERRSTWSVIAYLQLPAAGRAAAVRNAFAALRRAARCCWSPTTRTNLAEGTGGPQDPRVLMTAEDVLGDLAGRGLDVVRAERVARVVPPTTTGTRGDGVDERA